jgi:hypothetical protein
VITTTGITRAGTADSGRTSPDRASASHAAPDVTAIDPPPALWLGERTDPTVQRYEERARAAESSPYPVLLKVGRVIVWMMWAVVAVNALILTVAFLFHLGGADAQASFANWVYRSADHSMAPFRGIFPTHTLSGRSVLDISLLFAAGVYIVGALALDAVHRWLGAVVATQQEEIAAARAAADVAALRFEQRLAG